MEYLWQLINTIIISGLFVYMLTYKSSKRKAKAEAEGTEVDVNLRKIEATQNIEKINIERIENLLRIVDEKNDIFIKIREENLHFKIQIRDFEGKIKILENDMKNLSMENSRLRAENASFKEQILKLISTQKP